MVNQQAQIQDLYLLEIYLKYFTVKQMKMTTEGRLVISIVTISCGQEIKQSRLGQLLFHIHGQPYIGQKY